MPTAHDQHLVNPAPTGRTRVLTSAFILIFLLYQMLVPLRYYYHWNFGTNATDERFSWRFFSSVSLRQCEHVFDERMEDGLAPEDRPIPIQSIVKLGSIKNFVQSNHRATIEKLLRWRCDQPGVAEVLYSCACVAPDGTPLAPVHLMIDKRTRVIRTFAPAQ